MKNSATIPVLTALLLAAPSRAAEPGPLQAVENDQGIAVREGEAEVLFYQRAIKSLEGKRPRANYVHPLYDLNGEVLSEDFPADHLHHRGIFWAWHQLWIGDTPIGDGWSCDDFLWDVQHVAAEEEGESRLSLKAHVVWKSPRWTNDAGDPKPLVDERTTIRVHKSSPDSRAIDFEIALLALEDAMRLGGSDDEKGYGGFSVRVRLPEGVRFTGEKGEVAPQTTSVEAGPWLDVTARYGDDDRPGGVAILCHPSSPGFPQRWILRESRSMQNPVYPGRDPVALSKTEPLLLRYRLVVHRGEADADRVSGWFREYAKEGAL
jgi:hypothetical protein